MFQLDSVETKWVFVVICYAPINVNPLQLKLIFKDFKIIKLRKVKKIISFYLLNIIKFCKKHKDL